MRRARRGVVLFLMILTTLACLSATTYAKPKLSEKKITLARGQKKKLTVTGTNKKVKWSSKNKKVAKVSKKGVVTGVKAGKTTIVAKVGKKKLKCKVTVSKATALLSFSDGIDLKKKFLTSLDENKGFALDGFDSTTSLKSDDFDEKAATAAMKLVDSFSSPTGETFAKVRNDYGKAVYVTVSCAFRNGNETMKTYEDSLALNPGSSAWAKFSSPDGFTSTSFSFRPKSASFAGKDYSDSFKVISASSGTNGIAFKVKNVGSNDFWSGVVTVGYYKSGTRVAMNRVVATMLKAGNETEITASKPKNAKTKEAVEYDSFRFETYAWNM